MDSAQLRVDRGQTTVDTASAAGKILSHRDLLVWRKAMDLVDSIYDIAEGFPANESYRLTSQITRAVVSVPANIAEGQARSTAKDFANFLSIAKGSLMETETLLTVAVRRSYVTETVASVAFAQITEISKMPTSLRSRVRMSKRRLQ